MKLSTLCSSFEIITTAKIINMVITPHLSPVMSVKYARLTWYLPDDKIFFSDFLYWRDSMNSIFEFFLQWIGVILCMIFLIIFSLSSHSASTTKEEKTLENDDNPENYLVKNSGTGIIRDVILMLIAAAGCFLIGYLASNVDTDTIQYVIFFVEIGISIVCGVIYYIRTHKVLVQRVMVTGNDIRVYPAFGKQYKTSFSEIRTVKKNGGQTAAESTSLVIRPNGGKRFTVTHSMRNYDKFARKIDSDVTLPDLTKKQKPIRDEDDDFDEEA